MALKPLVKVGEYQIPAQDEVKRLGRNVHPDVLMSKLDLAP
jgi:hypothetical protein